MGNNKGKASAELLLAMLLLVLFAIATFTLTASGTDAYIATAAKTENSSDLRVAVSYIYTRARQSMDIGAIRVEQFDEIDGDCLVMQQRIEGILYDMVIFVHEGYLSEALLTTGSEPDPDSSFQISRLDSLVLKSESGGIIFEAMLGNGETEKTIEGFISTL